jgi:hypothetical protein
MQSPQQSTSAHDEVSALAADSDSQERRDSTSGLGPTSVATTSVPEPVVAPAAAAPSKETLHTREPEALAVATELPEQMTTALGPSTRAKGVAPEKRGGRPRGSSTADQAKPSDTSKRNEQTNKQRRELVCWLQGMAWVVGVDVAEEAQLPSLRLWQPPDVELEREESGGRHWRLKRPLESVAFATGPDETRMAPQEIPSSQYRIFKLIGARGDRGRAVREGSDGHFLVVVPESWRWNEELSGSAFGSADPVSPGGYLAHHVDLPLGPTRALAFNTPEDGCVRIPCADQRFELVGTRIEDSSTDAGALFVREPPQLRAATSIAEYVAIATVVVGEEGPTYGGRSWRVRGGQFEDVRGAIAERQAGWFFIRLYDISDELIESLDFRFIADLEGIAVEATSPMPGPDGHLPAQVHFHHARTCTVRSQASSPLLLERSPSGSRVLVPPDTRYDETHWLISSDNGRPVDVTVIVERIWWAHESEGTTENQRQWTDRPLNLSREDFSATSVTAIRLKLPRPGWADELRIGFDAARSRSVHLGVFEREHVIQLRDLGGLREVEEQSVARLRVWLTPGGHGAERLEGVVGSLPDVIAAPIQSDGLLRSLRQLKPARLMAVLTHVHPSCSQRLRHMISGLRTVSYKRIPKHLRGRRDESFVKEALCVLALAIEELEVLKVARSVPERWARRAKAALMHFPGLMSAVRSRYQGLDEECARKHMSRTNRKADRC